MLSFTVSSRAWLLLNFNHRNMFGNFLNHFHLFFRQSFEFFLTENFFQAFHVFNQTVLII